MDTSAAVDTALPYASAASTQQHTLLTSAGNAQTPAVLPDSHYHHQPDVSAALRLRQAKIIVDSPISYCESRPVIHLAIVLSQFSFTIQFPNSP